jgi:hypothetical protein
MHSKTLRYILAVLLPVCLLLPGQPLGAVLCIKADGHMAVEAAHKGLCAPLAAAVAERSDEHSHTILPSADTCGPCIDVPLLSNREDRQILSAPSSLSKLAPSLLALLPCVTWVYPESSPRDFVLHPPARASSLLALRTVVLLL